MDLKFTTYGIPHELARKEMHRPGQLWLAVRTLPKDCVGAVNIGVSEIVEHIRPLLDHYGLKLRTFSSFPQFTVIWRDTKIGNAEKLGSLQLKEIEILATRLQSLPTMYVQSIEEERTRDVWGHNSLEAEWRPEGDHLVRFVKK